MSVACAARPAAGQRGFSFLEVLIAMAILVVGSVSILSLFAIGVHHQVARRVEKRVNKVKPEVLSILQRTVDAAPPYRLPQSLTGENTVPLSVRGYSLSAAWRPNPWGGPEFVADAKILYRDRPIYVLKPIPIMRSTLDPTVERPEVRAGR